MIEQGWSRRDMLRTCGAGFGMTALAGLFAQTFAQEGAPAADPHAPRSPHHAPKARRVIFLFMDGGPSHVDLFDPKPRLSSDQGKPLPFKKPLDSQVTHSGNLLGSPFQFRKHGRSGIDVSELLPHTAKMIDEICVIRSMVADSNCHAPATLQMQTGEPIFSRPSLGSWLLYGLGSENRNLPGFVVVCANPPSPGAPLWGSSFLPAAYQGTWVADLKNPIANLNTPLVSVAQRREQLDFLKRLNDLRGAEDPADSRLNARVASFELAFRMQVDAPEAFDLSSEPESIQRLYGLHDSRTAAYGKQCLMARRLVERGVRFVQVYYGGNAWDHHSGQLRGGLSTTCGATDLPIAALLKDLRARGLLEDTLVLWGGEFGRTPTAEGDNNGRNHHPYGFTVWMAGGGVKGGMVHGATDEFGWNAIENKVHVHDLHATVLHLMGVDHERLTYRYAGRDYRLTDVYGNVVREILA
jgi:hypothetical protein